MLIAKINNGVVIEIADYRQLFPETSFSSSGPNKSFYDENSCLPVSVWKEHDPETEQLVSCDPYIEDEFVFTVQVKQL